MKIDIIIPAYNAHNTIFRTLASIAVQSIIDDVEVIIVDDCSDKDYSEFIELFSKYMSIREYRLEKNMGSGHARQRGIEETTNPLITFVDADDTLAGAFALQELRKNLLENQFAHTCVGSFLEEHENSVYLQHPNDMVWIFGKLYKREFLEKYDIKFNDTRANEDNGFNTLIRLCSSEAEQIIFIPDTVYYWHMRDDSITRINNCQYSYDQSFVGYVDNMIYAITEGRKRKPYNGMINQFAVQVMCQLYIYYIETVHRDERFIEQNWKYAKKYYDEIYSKIEDTISDEALAETYNDAMQGVYASNRLMGIIPEMTIYDFLKNLKEQINEVN